jgi:glycopeptide antibiotics resistance protein
MFILIFNLVAYIPVGYYLSKRLNFKNRYVFVCFILYILLIEYLQYYFRTGFFDIADILFNSTGFLIGVAFNKTIFLVLKKTFKKAVNTETR